MTVLLKCGRKLVGERMRKPSSIEVSGLLFGVVVYSTREDIDEVAGVLDDIAADWD